MKYSIAKLPLSNFKIAARRSYDSSRCRALPELGHKKLSDFIVCISRLMLSNRVRHNIVYDANSDICCVSAHKYSRDLLFKLEFHLNFDGEEMGYTLKLDKIDWTKIVKDSKLFTPDISADGDTLIVNHTNHAELKMVINAVKRHYAKYNLCQHYENYTGQAVNAESDFETKDETLINEIHKHAKRVVTNRVNALIKKFKIKSDMITERDTYIYGESKYATNLSEGKIICNIAVQPILSHSATSKRHIAPTFYFMYYVNMKNGKITWRFCDELFNANEWSYRASCSAKDDEIFFEMNMYRLKDIDLKANPNSYEDWYKKYACVEFIENEIKKVLAAANVKAFI